MAPSKVMGVKQITQELRTKEITVGGLAGDAACGMASNNSIREGNRLEKNNDRKQKKKTMIKKIQPRRRKDKGIINLELRKQISCWPVSSYPSQNSANGAGNAQAFLISCLTISLFLLKSNQAQCQQ